jgi:hypothetical protein
VAASLMGPSRLPLRAAAPALTDPAYLTSVDSNRHPSRRWHNGAVTDSGFERDVMSDGANQAESEEDLIARLATNRRAGRDATRDVQELLKFAGNANRAALDRLAR